MIATIDPLRWGGALALVAGYAGMCASIWRAHAARRAAPSAARADWLVVHASQTGSAEYLAQQTAALLATGGLAARAACISSLDPAALASASRILFICATYGEGDAPDNAARFAGVTMASAPDLSHLHYAVLALGDSSYTNYCGFGRALDGWLRARGATALFERIDVDRGDAGAIAGWQHQLSHAAGTVDAPDWEAPAYGSWRIAARRLLNPGSAGSPLYHVALAPQDGALPGWEAGDLVQVSAPLDPDHPREYSIASVPADGRIELLVRLQQRADGSTGAASGWLCQQAVLDDRVALRVRAHPVVQDGLLAQPARRRAATGHDRQRQRAGRPARPPQGAHRGRQRRQLAAVRRAPCRHRLPAARRTRKLARGRPAGPARPGVFARPAAAALRAAPAARAGRRGARVGGARRRPVCVRQPAGHGRGRA
jgi:sulfite reductase (NADPH) flavoprotein alpha-component